MYAYQREQRPQPERERPPATAPAQPASSDHDAPDALPERLDRAVRGGEPLDRRTRRRLERTLGGVDLSRVRLHTDRLADDLARSLHAVAFTTDEHIFVRDRGRPLDGDDGAELLRHEVAHTIQQAAGPVEGREVAPGLTVSSPTDRHETEADDASAGRGTAPVRPGDAPRPVRQVQRFFDFFDDMFSAPEGTSAAEADTNTGALKAGADAAKSGLDIFGEAVEPLFGKDIGMVTKGFGYGLDILSKGTDAAKGERSAGGTISELMGTTAFDLAKEVGGDAGGPSPWEIAAKVVGGGSKLLGGPAELSEGAEMFGKSTGSGMTSQIIESGARAYGEIGSDIYEGVTTGDWNFKGVNTQVEEMMAGKAGPLQGYAMGVDLLATGLGSGDWEGALAHATEPGKDSILAKAGNLLGDEAYGLVHGDEDKSSLVKGGNILGDEVFGLMHGDSSKSSILEAMDVYDETGYGLTDWIDDEISSSNSGPSSYDAADLGESFEAGTPYDPTEDMGFFEEMAYNW